MGTESTAWEQRWHPLLQEWVIYSAHRQNRPWTGEQSPLAQRNLPAYAADCYLCPGNKRVGGSSNPEYTGVFVFDNDRPSISFDAPRHLSKPQGFYQNKPALGLTRVICYSPEHNVTMSEMSVDQATVIVNTWQQQTRELADNPEITSVAIFENKGEICGMSNPHPHGQVYATNFVYKTISTYLQAGISHRERTGRKLFDDILSAELTDGSRIVVERNSVVAFIPYFARFAYEVYIAPKRSVAHITALNSSELKDLASALREVLIRMDNLWSMPFPYLLMLQQAPVDGKEYPLFHFHIAIYPPLRTPQLRKHVAAHEIGGGNFLADTMPEDKAEELRAVSSVHYKAVD